MPSYGVCGLAKDFGETLKSATPPQKCAPEVYLNTKSDMHVRLPSCFLLYQNFARVAESG